MAAIQLPHSKGLGGLCSAAHHPVASALQFVNPCTSLSDESPVSPTTPLSGSRDIAESRSPAFEFPFPVEGDKVRIRM